MQILRQYYIIPGIGSERLSPITWRVMTDSKQVCNSGTCILQESKTLIDTLQVYFACCELL